MNKQPICQRVSNRFVAAWAHISPWLPMLRRTHAKQVAYLSWDSERGIKQLQEGHKKELADQRRILDEICNTAAKRTYRRAETSPCYQTYQISIAFDPSMFGGLHYHTDQLRFLARHVGHMVEHEIATAKFIELERNERYAQLDRMLGSTNRAGR